MVVGPLALTVAFPFTTIGFDGLEAQFVVLLVKINVAVPADIPVTMPALVMVATAGLLLDQLPPLVGERVVVLFTHMLSFPVIFVTGF
jgi:hypothetical protein